MVPKGSRPAARKSTAGWLAQCGGGMCRGIWFVRVGYCFTSCLAASSPPALEVGCSSRLPVVLVVLVGWIHLLCSCRCKFLSQGEHRMLVPHTPQICHSTPAVTTLSNLLSDLTQLERIEQLRTARRTRITQGYGDDEPQGHEGEEGAQGDGARAARVPDQQVEHLPTNTHAGLRFCLLRHVACMVKVNDEGGTLVNCSHTMSLHQLAPLWPVSLRPLVIPIPKDRKGVAPSARRG